MFLRSFTGEEEGINTLSTDSTLTIFYGVTKRKYMLKSRKKVNSVFTSIGVWT